MLLIKIKEQDFLRDGENISDSIAYVTRVYTVFPRFSAPGHLPILEVFKRTLNRAGAPTRAGALTKTGQNLRLAIFSSQSLPFYTFWNNKYEFYIVTLDIFLRKTHSATVQKSYLFILLNV